MNNAAWFSVNLARQVYGIMRRVAQKKASIQKYCMLRLAMSNVGLWLYGLSNFSQVIVHSTVEWEYHMGMVFIYKVLKRVGNFFGLAKVWCGGNVNCE